MSYIVDVIPDFAFHKHGRYLNIQWLDNSVSFYNILSKDFFLVINKRRTQYQTFFSTTYTVVLLYTLRPSYQWAWDARP